MSITETALEDLLSRVKLNQMRRQESPELVQMIVLTRDEEEAILELSDDFEIVSAERNRLREPTERRIR